MVNFLDAFEQNRHFIICLPKYIFDTGKMNITDGDYSVNFVKKVFIRLTDRIAKM